jgi:hypothetical protein
LGLVCLKQLPLVVLNVNGCRLLTDAGLVHLQHMRMLNVLNISGCKLITDAGLVHLRRIPLRRIHTHGCNLITDAGRALLLEMHPRLYLR